MACSVGSRADAVAVVSRRSRVILFPSLGGRPPVGVVSQIRFNNFHKMKGPGSAPKWGDPVWTSAHKRVRLWADIIGDRPKLGLAALMRGEPEKTGAVETEYFPVQTRKSRFRRVVLQFHKLGIGNPAESAGIQTPTRRDLMQMWRFTNLFNCQNPMAQGYPRA